MLFSFYQRYLPSGGSISQPGEISLVHNGVLFLDEFGEFNRSVLDVMRQPLEDRTINIGRARMSLTFPANFILVAAMNPSYPNGRNKTQYLGRVSGPLLDRIDIHLAVEQISFLEMVKEPEGKSSEQLREGVLKARQLQKKRFMDYPDLFTNAQMSSRMIRDFCVLDESGRRLLYNHMQKHQLSSRAYDRILTVARTITDIVGKSRYTVATYR